MEDQGVKKVERIVLQMNKSGMEYLSHEQYRQALQLLKKAEKVITQQIKSSQKDPILNKLVGITFNNLGCYYKKTNKPKVALNYLKKALQIQVYNVQDWISTAGTHLNMCAIFSYLGKHTQAADHASLSIRLLQRESKRTKQEQKTSLFNILMISYYNLGVQLQYMKQNTESREAYKKAFELAKTLPRGQNMVKVVEECIERLDQIIESNQKRFSQIQNRKKQLQQKGHYEFMRKNRKNEQIIQPKILKSKGVFSQTKLRINSTTALDSNKLQRQKSEQKMNSKLSVKLK